MKNRFTDKVAIVTGASSGIGLATAMALAQEGAHVSICARNQEMLDAAQAKIKAAGFDITTASIDITDTEAFKAFIKETADKAGRLDVLVNNAAVTRHGPISGMSLEHWHKNFSVTVDATFVGTKTAMAIMFKQGGGAIVNISSSLRQCGSPGCGRLFCRQGCHDALLKLRGDGGGGSRRAGQYRCAGFH